MPALHALRRRLPKAHIAWLVATPFADLLSGEPDLSEVIPFDRRRFGRLGRSLSVTRDFAVFVATLRRRRFDLVIDLQGLFRSAFMAFATGAPIRIGFADAREMAPMFYTHRAPRAGPDQHAADRNLAALALLGAEADAMDFAVRITDADRAAARRLLDEAGLNPRAPYAVLAPGTRWETKCWPAERFGETAAALHRARGLQSVLVGGGDDVPLAERAVRAVETKSALSNLCGKTSLRQLAAVIESAAVVVTADSTPMHLAVAFGRPLAALFGPTHPRRTGPYGRLGDVIRLDLACSPCYYRRLVQCPHGHACMRDLDTDRVVAAVLARLDRSAATAPLP